MSPSVSPVPEGYHTVTPYLVVSEADAVLAFIQEAFGPFGVELELLADGSY